MTPSPLSAKHQENQTSLPLTVLVPNYNGARFVERTLQSLVNQSTSDFEVQVWDDGSSDNSADIAVSFVQSRSNWQLFKKDNVGIGANWNRAIVNVKTPLFTLLHCDDEYDSGYVAEMVALMQRFPDAGIGHCAAVAIDEHSAPIYSALEAYKLASFFPEAEFSTAAQQAFSHLQTGNFINCPSVIYRTAVVRQLGVFDIRLQHCLDWEYWFRLTLADIPIVATRQALFRYRRHENNASRANARLLRRYREEVDLLMQVHEQGVARGWCGQGEVNLTAVRQGAIMDLCEDLKNRDSSAATAKLNFVQHQAGVSLLMRLAMRGLILFGRVGGKLGLAAVTTYVTILGWMVSARQRYAN
jgi:glycosyltransferase involved in cell wall biosynthesis